MDFTTHAAVGALVGRAVAPDQPRAARWGALAALAPDADHVLEWASASAYLVHHRSASHSVLVVSLLALAAAVPGGARRARTAVVAAALARFPSLSLHRLPTR